MRLLKTMRLARKVGISSSDEDIINDESCSTELTMIDIKHMKSRLKL